MTNIGTSGLRKVKEIGPNPTTRFEDMKVNCGLGYTENFCDVIMTSL